MPRTKSAPNAILSAGPKPFDTTQLNAAQAGAEQATLRSLVYAEQEFIGVIDHSEQWPAATLARDAHRAWLCWLERTYGSTQLLFEQSYAAAYRFTEQTASNPVRRYELALATENAIRDSATAVDCPIPPMPQMQRPNAPKRVNRRGVSNNRKAVPSVRLRAGDAGAPAKRRELPPSHPWRKSFGTAAVAN